MREKTIRLRNCVAVAFLLAVLAAGCAHPTALDNPSFEGVILESVTHLPTSASPARIQVTVDAATRYDSVGLHIWPDTEIVIRANGSFRRGSPSDLIEGARYRAWHDGTEMRSYPPQYRATRIEIWKQ
jgi:hypothetical protein